MDIKNLVAIDVHTHAHVSHSVSEPPGNVEVQEAANRYFKHEGSSMVRVLPSTSKAQSTP
jgi:hypothetical protein